MPLPAVLSSTMVLYFVLMLVFDLMSGSETWALYLPGIVAGVAVASLTTRRSTTPPEANGEKGSS
ncbi:multisubunit Na+/H+ antiporter MnhE subunit [Arthrobacter bambusae]|uniref:Multisubunit Na+/H+ antiporter MnhE subunit n=1 Tax=Arthrobacter bambusae TaxID=1338426 RepID=A0ABV2P0Z1_9MICC